MEEFKYKGIFQADAQDLIKILLPEFLKEHGYKKQRKGAMYLYAEGDLPILLVAHVDTVHTKLPADIFYDSNQEVVWSPQGIGADDRAGVLGLLKIIDNGFKPHILFTDGEEIGGIGATEASEALSKEIKKRNIRYMIELDRKGNEDACFYNCGNWDFADYITKQGFKEAIGSFSDISILMPAWDIAGVNLSTGYYNAHMNTEYLKLNELWNTVAKVEDMLKNIPKTQFKHEGVSGRYAYGYSTTGLSKWKREYLEKWQIDEEEWFKEYEKEDKKKGKNKSKSIKTYSKNYYEDKIYSEEYDEEYDTDLYDDSLYIIVSPAEFSDLYGGKVGAWAKFFRNYGTKIENKGLFAVRDCIFDNFRNEVNEFIYDY